MTLADTAQQPRTDDVLERLGGVCTSRGLEALASKLIGLGELVRDDMGQFEAYVRDVPGGDSLVHKAGQHLLDLGGKRLRPLCVVLASKVGNGFDDRAKELAVAVELVHNATLLHDDVIDLGDRRRGAPTARAVYGNAASIFAGDWLLVEALKRVHRAGIPGVLERLLEVIEIMIFAESIQLENRGKLDAQPALWLDVVEGKTASLFRWAMWSGARAGGLEGDAALALEQYGLHLGVAFQAVDDVLDLTGDHQATGKALFADLREGKMTYPLIVALDRDPGLRPVVREIVTNEDLAAESVISEATRTRVLSSMADTGAIADCLALARERVDLARASLARVPDGAAKEALLTVAETAINRKT